MKAQSTLSRLKGFRYHREFIAHWVRASHRFAMRTRHVAQSGIHAKVGTIRTNFLWSCRDWSKYDATPATKLAKLHHSVADAVKRVNGLEWDKTRTPPQQHQAGRKIAEATVAEIEKTRAELKTWAANETDAAMSAIEAALSPDIGTAAQVVRSEIRAFVLSKKGDPDFIGELRNLVETGIRFATAILEAPAAALSD